VRAAEEEESLFSTCAGKTHCMCEEFKIHSSALPGGQCTFLRKAIRNFVLICREEEFLPVEGGLSVPPPPLVMLLATETGLRSPSHSPVTAFLSVTPAGPVKGRKLSWINPVP